VRSVYFGWHTHAWEDLVALARHAESLGYEDLFVDGDVSQLEKRPDADCLDGWTTTVALLTLTERIGVGSIRLAHHWNAARLAQASATAARIAPGRFRFLAGLGDWPVDARFGLAYPSAAERVGWLDETLDAVRALWRGERVTREGRFVRLDAAQVRPAPGDDIAVRLAARRPRMLELVAKHADVWDVNLPPLREPVARATEQLAAACAARGRDASEIGRAMLLFARPGFSADAALRDFRRFNPWFRAFADDEIAPQLLCGEPAACRAQLDQLAADLTLSHPVIDASGLAAGRARELLEALAPANSCI
jgi:alkanesulfonate monooxygenase SsuD/methylene tetrahydromethanopterin reductase-like flavin-dependent oxidoreductase (luciferase family)